jgi:hypothetical protein
VREAQRKHRKLQTYRSPTSTPTAHAAVRAALCPVAGPARVAGLPNERDYEANKAAATNGVFACAVLKSVEAPTPVRCGGSTVFSQLAAYLSEMLTVRKTPSPRSIRSWYVPALNVLVLRLKMYWPLVAS